MPRICPRPPRAQAQPPGANRNSKAPRSARGFFCSEPCVEGPCPKNVSQNSERVPLAPNNGGIGRIKSAPAPPLLGAGGVLKYILKDTAIGRRRRKLPLRGTRNELLFSPCPRRRSLGVCAPQRRNTFPRSSFPCSSFPCSFPLPFPTRKQIICIRNLMAAGRRREHEI